MFITKHGNSPKICINIRFNKIKLNNNRRMTPLVKNMAKIWPFDPIRNLKFLNKLHKCICSA